MLRFHPIFSSFRRKWISAYIAVQQGVDMRHKAMLPDEIGAHYCAPLAAKAFGQYSRDNKSQHCTVFCPEQNVGSPQLRYTLDIPPDDMCRTTSLVRPLVLWQAH